MISKIVSHYRRSLAARLVAGAAIWSAVVLLLAGVGLSGLYRDSVERQLDRELIVVIDALGAEIATDSVGARLGAEPNDPRYFQTFSGRYWQISEAGRPILRARSLWDFEFVWPPSAADPLKTPGAVVFADTPGPDGQRLRAASVALVAPQRAAPLVFTAAADRKTMDAEIDRFTATLALALVALAAGLVVAVVLQVRVGLAPLEALSRDVAEVRRGARERLGGDYPREVAPLTQELDKLLEHNREIVERARTHVGNLAHALKTPISVLMNEARSEDGPLAGLVRRQTESMSRNVEHYLRRAQAAARAEAVGVKASVMPVITDIARTLERLHGGAKDLDLEVEAAPGAERLAFRGERQDFEEMGGNLMDNACKYGAGVVRVRLASAPEGRLSLVVEDDGPGLPPERIEEALKRGGRLDETAPGQGLGLSIVAELARLYGGALDLGRSELGGLRAELTLPAAD